MKAEPPLDAKCKDKFLVQSVPISPEHEFSNPGAVVGLSMEIHHSPIVELTLKSGKTMSISH